ncbi:MAG: helix-turn-helix domain-containing protein [Pseudobdellovibrionaceae bacterium]|nr:helix-turn-helix domain-containing protein [Pseudobdellovibrionaceae bacterium]
MKTLADLIMEWLKGGPGRSAASLSRATGVPRNTISAILSGSREPDIRTILRMVKVLPRDHVTLIVLAAVPEIQMLFDCHPHRTTASTMQLCS